MKMSECRFYVAFVTVNECQWFLLNGICKLSPEECVGSYSILPQSWHVNSIFPLPREEGRKGKGEEWEIKGVGKDME